MCAKATFVGKMAKCTGENENKKIRKYRGGKKIQRKIF